MKIIKNTTDFPDDYILSLAAKARGNIKVKDLSFIVKNSRTWFNTGHYNYHRKRIVLRITRAVVNEVYFWEFKPEKQYFKFSGNFEMDIFSTIAHEIYHHKQNRGVGFFDKRFFCEHEAELFAKKQTSKLYPMEEI